MIEAPGDGVIPRRFTLHRLRPYYTTQHKAQYEAPAELHGY
jgi:hypothetical protein